MPHGEKISLGILIGFVMFFLMVGAYKKGEDDANVDNASYLRTIKEQQKVTERYKSLYIQGKQDIEILTEEKRRREKLLLQVYMYSVQLEHKLKNGR